MNTNTSGIIKIYNYTSDTHELIGGSDGYCDESTPLIPYCTMEPPPVAKHGYAITFDSTSQEWSYHEDHRGAVVYDTKTGQEIIIEQLGSLPSER
ncbi:hypothetical protein B5C26_08155 [Photorhabdus luminescens]|uniref:hypothetical protein n=1 Tax=Photorhabdus luminescens TaxID=29488 RepID=UPI000B4C9601|nr:hypothetical protein [Photorhabdus luminescens]OWO82962.1 hypothetical protein B5C26_08155 [Photorhabdus luminescens]